jgi:SAM-dependent methyltransferase
MVTESDVALAYRFFLGREPESRDMLRAHLDCSSFEALRGRFLGCPEFRDKLGDWFSEVAAAQTVARVPLSVAPLEIELEPTAAELQRMGTRIAAAWRQLGASEPHWSVLSADEFRSAHIAENERAFYDTGEYDAELLRSALQRCAGGVGPFDSGLEYGCGVGRATWKLAPLFQRLTACDISDTHLELARRWSAGQRVPNVEFRKIESPLRPLAGLQYDIFYSRMVLQHNPPPIMRLVLRAALDGLRPGGVALFQLPTYGQGYSFRTREYLASPADGRIEMHCLPQPAVFELAHLAGCEVLEVREDEDTGQPSTFVSNTFVVRRPSN